MFLSSTNMLDFSRASKNISAPETTVFPPNVQKETKFNRSLALGANLRSGVVETLKIDCS